MDAEDKPSYEGGRYEDSADQINSVSTGTNPQDQVPLHDPTTVQQTTTTTPVQQTSYPVWIYHKNHLPTYTYDDLFGELEEHIKTNEKAPSIHELDFLRGDTIQPISLNVLQNKRVYHVPLSQEFTCGKFFKTIIKILNWSIS